MRVPSSPLQFTWDPTSRCPARCVHCYNAAGEGATEEFDQNLLDKTLASVLETRPLTVGIGGGDPLVYDGLEGIVRALYETLGGHMPSLVIGSRPGRRPK